MQHTEHRLCLTHHWRLLGSLYMSDNVFICLFTSHSTVIQAASQDTLFLMNKCKCLKYDNVNNVKRLFVDRLKETWAMLATYMRTVSVSCLPCSSCRHHCTLIESTLVDMVGLGCVCVCVYTWNIWTPGLILLAHFVLFPPSVRSPDKQTLNTEICFLLPKVGKQWCSYLHVSAQICLMPPKRERQGHSSCCRQWEMLYYSHNTTSHTHFWHSESFLALDFFFLQFFMFGSLTQNDASY